MSRFVLVGPGRVGSALVRAAAGEVEVVPRGEPLPAVPVGTPIVLATRADALAERVRETPPENRADLVFLQNGMILPSLRALGVAEATQGLVYFAATSTAGPVEPGAPTLFWGRHAPRFVALLERARIPARVVAERDAFRREIAIKLAWNVIFGVLGDTWDEPVGASAARRAEVESLAEEIAPVLALGVETEVPVPELVDRLLAYSAAIPAFRAGVRELPWRSGWVRDAARAAGRATPRHDALLAALGH
jgi:ketopantoate reductase